MRASHCFAFCPVRPLLIGNVTLSRIDGPRLPRPRRTEMRILDATHVNRPATALTDRYGSLATSTPSPQPFVAQAWPKTMAPETRVDRTEIETYWNRRQRASSARSTGAQHAQLTAAAPEPRSFLARTVKDTARDNMSGCRQANVTPVRSASCSTI